MNMQSLANLARRWITGPISQKFSEVWVSSTVTVGEATGGRNRNSPPGAVFVGRATQYVLICARLNAGVCASQRLRLYAPASSKAKAWWRGKRLNASTPKEKKRLAYLKRWRNGPGSKAAEYAEYAEDVQEVTDHPALDLLNKPNPWQTGGEFCEMTYLYQELAGNAFINVYMDEAIPEMYQLGPQWTSVIPSETEFIAGYRYARDASDPHNFPVDEVMHFKHGPNPLSPYYGLGPLQAVIREADLAAAATDAEYYRWLNGGRPDFVVEVPADTTPEQRAQIKAEIARETQGVKKSGKYLMMGNSKVVPLGFRPKDMEYLNGLTRSDELIWNAFGVPQSELKMNDANYASASTGNVQYLGRTIAPRCCRMADMLTTMLLPKFGVEPGSMWFAYDEIVPEDEQNEAEMDRADVAAGVMTLNEARANRGLEPYDPAVGDVCRINGTSVERLDAPPMPPPQFGGNTTNVDATQNDGETVAAKVLAGLLPHIKGKDNERTNGRQRKDDQSSEGDQGPAGRDFFGDARELKFYGPHSHKDATLTDAPAGTYAKLDGFAGRLEAWYRSAIADALAKGTTGVVQVSGVELEKIIEEELAKLFTFSASQAAKEVGMSLEVAPASALEFLGTYRVRLAQAVTADISDALTATIKGGIENGQSYEQVTRMIEENVSDFTGWRAERIARTETSNTLTEGRVMAWDELGVGQKQWLLSANACEFCEAAALTYLGPIPMNQPFYKVGDTILGTQGGVMTVSWRDVNGAPLHPACACGLLPVLE